MALLYNQHKHTKCTASILSPKWLVASYSCVFEAFAGDNSAHHMKFPGDNWVVYAGHTFVDLGNMSLAETYDVKRIVAYSGVSIFQIVGFSFLTHV